MRPKVAGAKALLVNGGVLSLTVSRPTDVVAELFDVTGHSVANLYRGSLASGTHRFTIDAAKGVYFVKVRGQGLDLTRKVILK
jgi:hypothetical protein